MAATIVFETNGDEHVAVVSSIPVAPRADALVREHDGRQYEIFVAFAEIPGYPGVGFIARPIVAG